MVGDSCDELELDVESLDKGNCWVPEIKVFYLNLFYLLFISLKIYGFTDPGNSNGQNQGRNKKKQYLPFGVLH